MTERCLQEPREGLPRHLAGPHGELVMPDAAEPAHMSIDGNIERGIGENEIGALVLQEMIVALGMSGIAAQQPMPIEEP